MTAVKKTFAESRAEIQAAKNNSDLANLAQALEAVEAGKQKLAALETTITITAGLIEAGKIVEVSEVRKLFEDARKFSNFSL